MMKKALLLIIALSVACASIAWATWSPNTNAWPDYRNGGWANNAAFVTGVYSETYNGNAGYTKYGSTLSAGSSAATIQAALNAAGSYQYVELAAGAFNIGSTTVDVPPNKELRGAGMASTTVTYTGTGAAFCLACTDHQGGSDSGTWNTLQSVTIAATSITVTSNGNTYSNGDLVYITEVEDNTIVDADGEDRCDWCGYSSATKLVGQYVVLSAKADAGGGNYSFTITPHAYHQYDNSPQLMKVTYPGYAGIRGFKISYTSSSVGKEEGAGKFVNVQHCWMKDIEVYGAREAAYMGYSFANTVTHCYFHECLTGYGSDTAYMVNVKFPNSDHYIYNNFIEKVRYGIEFEGGGAGVIIAYNFIRNTTLDDAAPDYTYMHSGIGFHGAHPTAVLVEGNIGQSFDMDVRWGSSSHATAFRNWFPIDGENFTWDGRTYESALVGSHVQMKSLYHSFVGNVYGYSGMSGYNYQNLDPASEDGSGAKACFSWGSGGWVDGTSSSRAAYNSGYVHRNYDYVAGAIKNLANSSCTALDQPFECCTGSGAGTCPTADTTLPDSLYLSSKPSWFGSITWPPINPSGPVLTDIPAKVFADTGVWPSESSSSVSSMSNITIGPGVSFR